MPESIDDLLMETLARGAGAARERAFRELVGRHTEPLAGFLTLLLPGDPSGVEDLLQETFLRVYQARERYRPGTARPSRRSATRSRPRVRAAWVAWASAR